LLSLHQPRVQKDLEVVADRGLGQPQRLGQVAHAGFGAGPGRDQAEELKPGGIRQDLDRLCQAFRVPPREGSVEQPGATTRRQSLDRIHADILTSVDESVKISTVIDTKGGTAMVRCCPECPPDACPEPCC
jgi:hypothetical protein